MEGIQLPHRPAALESAVLLRGVGTGRLEAMVEQLDQRASVEWREPDRDERRSLPAVADPVLLEGQLSRRIEHDDMPGEAQRRAVELIGVGLDLAAGPRLVMPPGYRFRYWLAYDLQAASMLKALTGYNGRALAG